MEPNIYSKTRYSIVELSIKKLIQINPEFKELLFFIYLLDPQNIPKELLEIYKDYIIVDNFIYHLKKHSLILSEISFRSGITLHSSSQISGLKILIHLLTQKEKEELLEKILSSIKLFFKINLEKNCGNINRLIPHLEAIVKNIGELSLPSTHEKAFKQDLLKMIGYAYFKCVGDITLAKHYFIKVFEMIKNQNYIPDKGFATMLKDLAYINTDLGLTEEVLYYSQQSLALCKQVKNINGKTLTAQNLTLMGVSYALQNDLLQAVRYFKEGLKHVENLDMRISSEIRAEINSLISLCYSMQYINNPSEAKKYATKALTFLNMSNELYNNSQNLRNLFLAKY